MAGTNYTRQSTFGDGDVITAGLFNNEFNQLLNAFAYATTGTTGHQHDGGAGEGGNIAVIGDQDFLNKILVDTTNNRWGFYVEVGSAAVEQIRIQDGAIVPVTDNDIDLGTSSLQFKDAYINGTLEADAITIAGITLSETIADTVGAMVTSNTETGITVTYEDSDNTLDFAIGTLNQNTTGNAATATALATARTIGGTSFDGTANIAVALSAAATALETSRTIHGVSFDGTANIDLSEVIADTVGAMFSSNTETGIIATYQDTDNTIDLVVSGSSNTTGNAGTATALETARTIGGVSFDGTANIDLAGVNTAGNQNTSGNAATATALATARTIGGTSFDGTANIAVGLAGTATALATARTIGGTSFDGTANIAVALATEATNVTAVANNSTDETVYVTFVDGVSGTQGIETDSGLTYNPSSGLITTDSATFSGTGGIKVPVGTTAQRPTNAAGQFRYNSTEGKFEGYTTEWGEIGGGAIDLLVNTFTGNGSTTAYTLSSSPLIANTLVYIDGVYQNKSAYSIANDVITFSAAPASGAVIEATAATVGEVSTASTSFAITQLTGNGSTTAFTLSTQTAENNTNVYFDGVYQSKANYSVSGNTLTFSTAPANGVSIEVMASEGITLTIGTPDNNTVTTAKIAADAVTSDKLAHSLDVVTDLSVGGASNGVEISNGAIALKNSGAQSKIDFYCETSNAHYTRIQAAPHSSYSGNIVLTLPASDGDAGQFLQSNGSGVMSWASVLTTIVTSSSVTAAVDTHVYVDTAGQTITLPASPTIGQRVLVTVGNFTNTVIGRNGSNIMSSGTDMTLDSAYLSIQFIYTNSTVGWAIA